MDYTIEINQNAYGFFIKIIYNYKFFTDDRDIIKILGLTQKFYFKQGKKFNAEICDNQLYFTRHHNAEEFKQWLKSNIDSFLIAKKMENK